MQFNQVNWIAVIIGTVAAMILGWLWYGPFFGKPWLAAMAKIGRKRENMQMSPIGWPLTILSAFVANLVLDLIILAFGVTSWWMGLIAGAVVWIGVGATSHTNSSIFEGRPWFLWTLFFFYELVVYAGMGLVYAVWR